VEIHRARARRRMQGWDERIRQSGEASEADRFREMLEQWVRGCPWCRAAGEEDRICGSHELSECGIEDADEVREAVRSVSSSIAGCRSRYASGSRQGRTGATHGGAEEGVEPDTVSIAGCRTPYASGSRQGRTGATHGGAEEGVSTQGY
jgi:hypothetical protein